MDVVLVGLPGGGKTEVGRRLAATIGTTFVDTDREVERRAQCSIAEIFERDGEPAFRQLDRAVVEDLTHGSSATGGTQATATRVIATGGGTVVDPRNRWRLYRDRLVVWLDAPNAVLAERLRRGSAVRPLLAGGDLEVGLERLRAGRERFYAAGIRVDASGTIADAVATIGRLVAVTEPDEHGTVLLRAEVAGSRVVLGAGIAARELVGELRRAGARRAVIVTEPTAWAAVGGSIRPELERAGILVEVVSLPEGEPAKRLGVVEWAGAELARLGFERGETLIAVGGGALTDVAGFLGATYQRGVPWLAVPTTLLGQLDAAHGGKTAVDIPAGKNLIGAFHLPIAVIVDVDLLASLPERHLRAALAEAVKDGVLADARLLEVLEDQGAAVASGRVDAAEPSALAEIVERAMWVKLGFVAADPTEHGDRIALNLGHTLGHAIEAAAGFGPILHGEAVAYGLRAACRLGLATGVTPADRADRIEALLDRLDLAVEPLDLAAAAVLELLATDKKRRSGAVRWVLPTGDGWTVRDDVPTTLVEAVAADVLSGRDRSTRRPVAMAAGRP